MPERRIPVGRCVAAAMVVTAVAAAGCSAADPTTGRTSGPADGVRTAHVRAGGSWTVEPVEADTATGFAPGRSVRVPADVDVRNVAAYGPWLVAVAPPEGARAADTPSTELLAVDTRSGSTVRWSDDPAWRMLGLLVAGDRLVWTESRTSASKACGDTEFGCADWRIRSLPLSATSSELFTSGTPEQLAASTAPSPARGVPAQPAGAADTLCWASSTDGRTWAVTVTHAGSTRLAATVTSWARDCRPTSAGLLVTLWNVDSAGNGYGDLTSIAPDGAVHTLASGLSQPDVQGRDLLAVQQRPGASGRSIVTGRLSADGSRLTGVREIVTASDVYGVGWLGPGQVWVWTVDGLVEADASGRTVARLATDVLPGSPPVLGAKALSYGALDADGNGHLVLSPRAA